MSLKSFPQDLVFVARSSVLIKGLAARLGVKWSLASKWAPMAVEALDLNEKPRAACGGAGACRSSATASRRGCRGSSRRLCGGGWRRGRRLDGVCLTFVVSTCRAPTPGGWRPPSSGRRPTYSRCPTRALDDRARNDRALDDSTVDDRALEDRRLDDRLDDRRLRALDDRLDARLRAAADGGLARAPAAIACPAHPKPSCCCSFFWYT